MIVTIVTILKHNRSPLASSADETSRFYYGYL